MPKESTIKENKNINSKSNMSEQYSKEEFLDKLEKSKKQYKEGKVHNAKTVFKELREKYVY